MAVISHMTHCSIYETNGKQAYVNEAFRAVNTVASRDDSETVNLLNKCHIVKKCRL